MRSDDDSVDVARRLDEHDELAQWRQRFAQTETRNGLSPVYLCGNSLGLMPLAAADAVQVELDAWQRLGVRGHFGAEHPWLSFHSSARPGLAQLTGAQEREVVAMNSLTVNLHLLLVSFYRPQGQRRKIVIERDVFPSDRFAVQSQMRWHGADPAQDLLEWAPTGDGATLDFSDLERLLHEHGKSIALMLLPGVQYYSGELLDMERLGKLARKYGIVLGIDLAHAIGNVPMQLHDWGIDFAVWCSYKYLNGGPGAVAGAYVHARHLDEDLPRLLGWWGTEESTRLKMHPEYRRAPGIDAWQLSNPSIFSLAPVVESLHLFSAAGIEALREKSIRLTGYLEQRLAEVLGEHITVISPRDPARRGCQLSLMIADRPSGGRETFKRLEELNVIVDWREPDVIRVAPAPFYNSFEDVHEFVRRLQQAAGLAP